jgi:predicted small secreted protein
MKRARTLIVAPLAAIALVLGACNMMRGLGQDIGVAGQTVEETAEDVQN